MTTSVQIVEISMLRYIPEILAWAVGIVLAVLMVRRGGGKAEKLLLAGCSLMFVARLASPLLSELVQSLMWKQDMSNLAKAQTMGWVTMPLTAISLAGLVCLVWGFWVKFWRRRQVST
jgi:hypothetical protein